MLQGNGHMEAIALNIHLLTVRNGMQWTKAKAMCAYMPGRGNHIDNGKAVKSAKRKGIMRYDSHNIFKAKNYEMQHKNTAKLSSF